MPNVPKLSLAAKLYAIFALLAAATIGLAAVAVLVARQQVILSDDLESAVQGSLKVEQVNGLIYAVVMESRGVYMSSDPATVKKYAIGLLDFNDRVGAVVKDWRRSLRAEDAAQFEAFSQRIEQFQEFRRELARRGTEVSPAAGREWGDNDANRIVRTALNKDLEMLARLYAERSRRIYEALDRNTENAVWFLSVLAFVTILLAALGAVLIRRAVAQPLAAITSVTEAVAAGEAGIAVPHRGRRDEIGALARSIAVFQQAMDRNRDLARTVSEDAEARSRRQDQVGAEIAAFAASMEATLTELKRISDQMSTAAAHLTVVADQASSRTAGATAASGEASDHVRDIASATEELTASVMEINRQVSHSNAVAEQAVAEAHRSNQAVVELDEAARRIGDVVRVITHVAEQTNLLALNATIEAARAGAAGRGFSVVANEVKSLAGQTAQATEDIAAQITGMQQATERSVQATARIQRTICQIGEISATIAAAVTEQGAATQEIARSAEVAAHRTTETAAEVGRVEAATADTRVNATMVKSVADDLSTVAARIRKQVDEFFQSLKAA